MPLCLRVLRRPGVSWLAEASTLPTTGLKVKATSKPAIYIPKDVQQAMQNPKHR